MALNLSTAGMMVAYALETSDDTKPTAFTNIPNPKSIPDLNSDPSTLDTTSLNVEMGGFKTYIQGLRDLGGALGVTFGMNQSLLTLVNDTLAKSENQDKLWIEFYHPSLTQAFFFKAQCAELGFPSADVDAVWDATVNFTPVSNIGWDTAVKPTEAAA